MATHQSVRNRLKNYLNVQLTDSKVVELHPEPPFDIINDREGNLFDSNISIIHELNKLENHMPPYKNSQGNSYLVSGYIKRQQNQFNRRHRTETRNAAITLKSKIKKHKQELQTKNQQYNYHRNREIQIKDNCNISKTPPRGKLKNNDTKNPTTTSEMADIQEKISSLPFQLRQKIKENLQRKLNLPSEQELSKVQQLSPFKNHQLILPQLRSLQSLQGQAQNQLIQIFVARGLEKDRIEALSSKQKFVSLNRETLSNNKSVHKSTILKDEMQIKQKYSTPHLKLHTDRNQESSKEKCMLRSDNFNNQLLNQSDNSKQYDYRPLPFQIGKGMSPQAGKNRRQQFIDSGHSKFTHIQKELNLKEALMQISQQFNKSQVIKNYTQILNSIPKCKKCGSSFGAFNLCNTKVIYSCNLCDLKSGLQRSISFLSSNDFNIDYIQKIGVQAHSLTYNHPIIGALFDIQNKAINEAQMRTFNCLLKEIYLELQKVENIKKRFLKLQDDVQKLKNILKQSSKGMFESKTNLKKYLSRQFSLSPLNSDIQNFQIQSVDKIVSPGYLTELDLWTKIKTEDFSEWPEIDKKLQFLCPLYMKKDIKTIRQFLDPLLYNFENANLKISVSQGLRLPVKVLNCATFIVDGSYNISNFERIQKLSLQFVNKRTFREITSMMQNLPVTVEELSVNYNHKLNSHISAQKYPILTKLASIRSCKKLYASIQNCKDEDDLMSALRVMTKKKELKLNVTRSIYVRKPVLEGSEEIIEMLKRLGKNIYCLELSLPLGFKEDKIYRQLLMTERNKLMQFIIKSTITDDEHKLHNFSGQVRQQEDNLMSDNLIPPRQKNDDDRSNFSNYFQNVKTAVVSRISFENKVKSKFQALSLLKQSYAQKETIQNLIKQNSSNETGTLAKHYLTNHTLRLQVLKMLL